ncbi:MAG: D-alanyl-D-alanine carboxypeptidase [Acidobacteriota bacterium]|nr:D-alanyl-D-alanine carboxypeptidase [Acidobacteriota bacterium]
MSYRHRSARRGIFTRLSAMLAGAFVAALLIVGMQLPLLHPRSSVTVTWTTVSGYPAAALAWPTTGSSALVIPALGVRLSHDDHVAPIASLTKMMTAYVTLKALPLGVNQTGPCLTVSDADLATYETMAREDQSSIPVVVGEQLCERQLLDGLLVHSAGNFATMLAELVAGNQADFITRMNDTAKSLGLRATHYADVSGYSPLSVSTALNQANLATQLMRSPVVRAIVIQPSVTLPVGGVEGSFTPYVGVDHVIGVKSGRTSQAGGCDVMAMTFQDGPRTQVLYAVVLGQRGGDLLGPAGDAALALANSAIADRVTSRVAGATVVARMGWPGHETRVLTARPISVSWWAAQGPPRVRFVWRDFHREIRAGEVVGVLQLRGSASAHVALIAARAVAPASLWQRLR